MVIKRMRSYVACAVILSFVFADAPRPCDARVLGGSIGAHLCDVGFPKEALSLLALGTVHPVLWRARLLQKNTECCAAGLGTNALADHKEKEVLASALVATDDRLGMVSGGPRQNGIARGSDQTIKRIHQTSMSLALIGSKHSIDSSLPIGSSLLRRFRRALVWQNWSHRTRIAIVVVAAAVASIVFYNTVDWVTILMTTRIALTAVLMNSGSSNPIPWDQTLVDKTIQDISDPRTKIGTLAYKATALAKIGHGTSALSLAREGQTLLEHLETMDREYLQMFGDILYRDVAVAFELANDQRAANDLIASMRNPYRKSEAMARQAVAQAEAGDHAGAKRRFDAAMEQLKKARGAFLGGIDLEPEYATIDPVLHREILSAMDDTVQTLVEIARCQYAAGLTREAHKSSEAVVTFLMDQARQQVEAWPPEDIANGLSGLLLAIPEDIQLVQKIDEIAHNFTQVGSGTRWVDTVNIGMATLWPAVGYAWAKSGKRVAAKQAFEQARQVTKHAHNDDDYLWAFCSLVRLQMDVGFQEDAHADIKAFMRRAGPLAKDLSAEARGELAVTLTRLSEFDQAEAIYRSREPIDVWPNQLATAAIIAGNTEKAFEYAKLAEDNRHLYASALGDIVRGLIGPLDRLRTSRPKNMREGGMYFMTILLLVASIGTFGLNTNEEAFLGTVLPDWRTQPNFVHRSQLTAT
jgi:tetratricopeptide (TPR) repeat protein